MQQLRATSTPAAPKAAGVLAARDLQPIVSFSGTFLSEMQHSRSFPSVFRDI
jgi:hypothetical protein